jgi:hypothetical protein
VLPGLTSVAGLTAARISGTLNGPGINASMVAKVVSEDTSVAGQYTAWVMAYDGGAHTKVTQIRLKEELVNGETVVKAYGLAEKYASGDRTNDATFSFGSWTNNVTAYQVYELRIKPAVSTDAAGHPALQPPTLIAGTAALPGNPARLSCTTRLQPAWTAQRHPASPAKLSAAHLLQFVEHGGGQGEGALHVVGGGQGGTHA